MFTNNDKYRVAKHNEDALADALIQLDEAYRRYREESLRGKSSRQGAEWRIMRARKAVEDAQEKWMWDYQAANRRARKDGEA